MSARVYEKLPKPRNRAPFDGKQVVFGIRERGGFCQNSEREQGSIV